jgi:hypothetical protein
MRSVVGLVLVAVLAAAAKDKKDLQKAPLPSELLTAKKVFLSKGVGATALTVKGGFDLAFDAFYSGMKDWGRYTITDKPEDADLIMQVSYSVESQGTEVNGDANRVSSRLIFEGNLSLVVYNSQKKTELWSTSTAPGKAFLKKNQEKEMIKAGEKLVNNLKERMAVSSPAPAPTESKSAELPK